MSYDAIERSRAKGSPVSLFFFRWGNAPSAYFAYTDAETEITYQGITYNPTPMQRGNIVASGTLDKSALELRSHEGTELYNLFRAYPPSQVVNCTIRQGHLSDPSGEFKVVWVGRIVQVGMQGNEAVFSGEPVATSMRRTGLRAHYQYSCRHALYGAGCRAVEADATTTTTADQVTNSGIVLPFGWTSADNAPNYLGGMVRWITPEGNNEVRTILRVSADGRTLELSGITRGLSPGQGVAVILGCNHQMSGCNMHNNINNFGGFAWIPKKNPVGAVNNYY